MGRKRRFTGSEQAFAIRPEKILLLARAQPAPDAHVAVQGRISGVTYLGATTRYAVALDGGGELVVVRQNAAVSRQHAVGDEVVLAWPRELVQPLRPGNA